MSSFSPSQSTIAQAFAITGLVLAGPTAYFFRNYSRVLEYVQMFYVFALTYAATTKVFSLNLGYGFISFANSFLNSYCTSDQFLCINGYLISTAVVWLGVSLLMLIVIKIISCRKSKWSFQAFYNFWKGIYRWFMPALVYVSTTQIINSIQLNSNKGQLNFNIAVGIAVFCLCWMFIQQIGHKLVQRDQQNKWKKWCEFFSTLRIISVIALTVVSVKFDVIAQYFIYVPILAYDIIMLTKYKFTFKVFQRVTFIIEEGVLITIFSFFIFNNQYIANNNLDLLGLALVIFLQLLLFIPKLLQRYNKDDDQDHDGQKVYPEVDMYIPKRISQSPLAEDSNQSRVNIKEKEVYNSPIIRTKRR